MSNLASPLEMFEALVDKLQKAFTSGVEAYDCVYNEIILLLPWILGMNGDNPMQSEFSSHIGMSGKCFCRICYAKGPDTKNRPDGLDGDKQFIEEYLSSTLEERTKAKVQEALRTQLEEVLRGAPSNVAILATSSGVKDKFFQFFQEKLADKCAKIKEEQRQNPLTSGRQQLIDLLKDLHATMPEDIFSPALRLEDFDPSSDTPVEILHVILLGFVKYFWRDAVSRQSPEGKEILKARINSFDTTGLGLPRARGNTLVQYAGSLTGRDFRLVIQIAPSVLHGLLPPPAYEAWLALARLTPLAFQPQTDALSSYLDVLENAIYDFLAATALWTTQWFNKPKFHVIVHMVKHIRRFGPAILSATESFESYNAVIHSRSINSNQQAPSLDIAKSFHHMHAVRDLVSGGYFSAKPVRKMSLELMRRAGAGVRSLVKDKVFFFNLTPLETLHFRTAIQNSPKLNMHLCGAQC
ncbi:hypothetical protein H0H81_002802, partial [Sphagnurus paluster]